MFHKWILVSVPLWALLMLPDSVPQCPVGLPQIETLDPLCLAVKAGDLVGHIPSLAASFLGFAWEASWSSTV